MPTENCITSEYNSYLVSKKKKRKYNEATNDSSHCGDNMDNEYDSSTFPLESSGAV